MSAVETRPRTRASWLDDMCDDDFAHIVFLGDTLCGAPRSHRGCNAVYTGQSICPGCGRPLCPRCVQLHDLEARLR